MEPAMDPLTGPATKVSDPKTEPALERLHSVKPAKIKEQSAHGAALCSLIPYMDAIKTLRDRHGDPQHVEDDGFAWVDVETWRRLRPGMVVAQVVGKSMESAVPDGAYCLSAAPSRVRARARPSSCNSATSPIPRAGSATPAL
jgi:hypothetical protein